MRPVNAFLAITTIILGLSTVAYGAVAILKRMLIGTSDVIQDVVVFLILANIYFVLSLGYMLSNWFAELREEIRKGGEKK